MKMFTRSGRWGVVGAGALLAASTALAPGASAITRANCSARGDYLNLHSNQTTCWANAGGISVRLYNVQTFSAGNNAGYVLTNYGRVDFKKLQRGYFPGAPVIVTYIYIY